MKTRPRRGSAVALILVLLACALTVGAAVSIRFDREAALRRREDLRVRALWLARSALVHPGSTELTLDRARAHLRAVEGRAEVVVEGVGTATVTRDEEEWTWVVR